MEVAACLVRDVTRAESGGLDLDSRGRSEGAAVAREVGAEIRASLDVPGIELASAD